jgi:hypothetical protein
VAEYQSALQLHQYLTIGMSLESARQNDAVDALWLTAQTQSAKLVAAGLGVDYGATVISRQGTCRHATRPGARTQRSDGACWHRRGHPLGLYDHGS